MISRKKYQFDKEYFRKDLKHHDWYIRLQEYLIRVEFPVIHDDPDLFEHRMKFYNLVEEMLEKKEIPLAKEGPDLDKKREEIDTLVIHHLEADPDIKLGMLSAIGLVRQYAKGYIEDDLWGEKGIRGKPIWSGHFNNGNMVFYAYHWLVRPDGKVENLLKDNEIGHHAKDVNPRSIGIVLTGNYEHATPPYDQIEATAGLIKLNYPYIKKARILGHREVMRDRTCPGDKFLGGWKNDLLSKI